MRERGFSLIICLGLLTLGCGDDGGGGGEGGSSGSGSDGGTASTMSTSAGMTTSSMTTAGTMSGDGTSTGEPPGDSGSTGMPPGDSSGTAGPMTSGSESGGTAGSTGGTTGGGGGAYPECDLRSDPPCADPYDTCQQYFGGDYLYCTVGCGDVADCPDPDSGTATVICAGQNQQVCMLDCADGATCPAGMDCIGVGPGGQFMRCAYPAP